VWNNNAKYDFIQTLMEWSCIKNGQVVDGKVEYAQCYKVSIGIICRGDGYCMLPNKSITYVSIGW